MHTMPIPMHIYILYKKIIIIVVKNGGVTVRIFYKYLRQYRVSVKQPTWHFFVSVGSGFHFIFMILIISAFSFFKIFKSLFHNSFFCGSASSWSHDTSQSQ